MAGIGATLLALSLLVWPAAGATAQLETPDRNDTKVGVNANYYQLKNPDSGLCLTLYNGNAFDGAPLVVMPCAQGGKPMSWAFSAGNAGNLSTQADPSRCADVLNGVTADGTSVLDWSCGSINPNQQWTLTNGGRLLSGLSGGWCLSIYGDNPTPGTIVVLMSCLNEGGSASPSPAPSSSPSPSPSGAGDYAKWVIS
ncbi:RICIN domain-containing protein [Micromonospora sp. HM134]|uniref:RICIN domain-containing protein n=1 Tax=Micromonospora sp. HM134 TaxID=2583243 RepID=UPI00143CE059|nr:RICIN domain-containing protein [Micromonospora sp. HM134]